MPKRLIRIAGCVLIALFTPIEVAAQARIMPAAIELGIDASMTTTEGIADGTVRARGGTFYGAFGGLAGLEVAAGYRHVAALDAADVEAAVSWQKRFREAPTYLYASAAAGLRYEDIGSFSQSLYPVGFGVGVRSLIGQRSGFRVEYRFRRILNDPSSDFSEHSVIIGLSVFFRNEPAGHSGGNPQEDESP